MRLQQGSGSFVAPRPTAGGIDCFVHMWAEQAHSLGYSVSDLQAALAQISETPSHRPWLVLDPDAELARIFALEISEAAACEVQSSGLEGIEQDRLRQFFLLVNDGNAAAVSSRSAGLDFLRVHLKSVAEIVHGLQRPAGPVLIGLVSRSRSILSWAETLLTALGFGPETVVLRNASRTDSCFSGIPLVDSSVPTLCRPAISIILAGLEWSSSSPQPHGEAVNR